MSFGEIPEGRDESAPGSDAAHLEAGGRSGLDDRGQRGRGEGRPSERMETYRIEVGRAHQVKPANIVGAIANESGLESRFIGRIEIFDEHSTVDLLEGMPHKVFHTLKKVKIAGRPLDISRADGTSPEDWPIDNPDEGALGGVRTAVVLPRRSLPRVSRRGRYSRIPLPPRIGRSVRR